MTLKQAYLTTNEDFAFIWDNINSPLMVRDRINVIKTRSRPAQQPDTATIRNQTLELMYDARIMDLEVIVSLSEKLIHQFPDDFSLKFSKQQASDEIKRIESLRQQHGGGKI